MQHAGIELGPHRYDPTLQTSIYAMLHSPVITLITRVRAGEVGVAHYPKWRRSLLIRAETRDFHSRRGMGARTIAMMTKIRKSRMSDFSCEKTKVCMGL